MGAPSSPDQVEVIVIGGGPVGLVSALQLGRAGVTTLLLERRASFSRHTKAGGIHARTMEIYRQWGLADTIRHQGGGGAGVFTAGWVTRLTGIELGSLTVGASQEELDLFHSWSPELMALCGQDIYEPILAEAAAAHPSVQLRLGAEAAAIRQDEYGVTVDYTDADGALRQARARYVIAADGVRSPVRQWLGAGEDALPSFGNSINVLFKAPLEAARAGRNYGLFWVVNGDTQGALSWKRRQDLWSYNFEAADGEDPALYTPERCIGLIRAATGVADLPVEVLSILHWQHDQSVTRSWRQGRVFLAGDAAHRFPPHGGFGMNSGVQDSHNLVWKLIARLRWRAEDALLDTYEAERRPVAQANGEQCLINTRRMAETGWLLKSPEILADIETPEGEATRQRIAAGVPKQREQFFSQGQQFGQIYTSSAVIDDGTEVPLSTVSDYIPTGSPGARAPHVWLTDEFGRRFSTIDLYDGGFVLLAAEGGEVWEDAARRATKTTGAPVSAFRIGDPDYQQDPSAQSWADLNGVSETGAVLVRPDGHVGARWAQAPGRPAQALISALSAILGTCPNVLEPRKSEHQEALP